MLAYVILGFTVAVFMLWGTSYYLYGLDNVPKRRKVVNTTHRLWEPKGLPLQADDEAERKWLEATMNETTIRTVTVIDGLQDNARVMTTVLFISTIPKNSYEDVYQDDMYGIGNVKHKVISHGRTTRKTTKSTLTLTTTTTTIRPPAANRKMMMSLTTEYYQNTTRPPADNRKMLTTEFYEKMTRPPADNRKTLTTEFYEKKTSMNMSDLEEDDYFVTPRPAPKLKAVKDSEVSSFTKNPNKNPSYDKEPKSRIDFDLYDIDEAESRRLEAPIARMGPKKKHALDRSRPRFEFLKYKVDEPKRSRRRFDEKTRRKFYAYDYAMPKTRIQRRKKGKH